MPDSHLLSIAGLTACQRGRPEICDAFYTGHHGGGGGWGVPKGRDIAKLLGAICVIFVDNAEEREAFYAGEMLIVKGADVKASRTSGLCSTN